MTIQKLEPVKSKTQPLSDYIDGKLHETPYLKIDYETLGVAGSDISCGAVQLGDVYRLVVYRYHSGGHIVADDGVSDSMIQGAASWICSQRLDMVQCNRAIASALLPFLGSYSLVPGVVMRAPKAASASGMARRASREELLSVAKLICGDSEIGKHYEVDELYSQLVEREKSQGCRSMVIERDGAIVAHAATYGESSDLAVIGGVKAGKGSQKGDGAVVLARKGNGPKIVEITTGKIVDMGVTDANNMGAAMAPAAADLLQTHFADTGRTPQDYDVIATGDLGAVGRELVVELLAKAGYEMDSRYTDCGIEIFDNETQDTHAGGSGCACSAVTFCAYFYPRLLSGEIGRMLFIPTGALMSPTSSQQGQSIPGIAHGLVIEGCKKGAKK